MAEQTKGENTVDENKTKMLAFMLGVLLKVVNGDEVTGNEVQSLENIAEDLGTYTLDEKEFRY